MHCLNDLFIFNQEVYTHNKLKVCKIYKKKKKKICLLNFKNF